VNLSMSSPALETRAEADRADSRDSGAIRDELRNTAAGVEESRETATGSRVVGWSESAADDDFNYIPVSPWAPLALCVGLIGLSGFAGLFGLYVAVFGVFLGLAAVSRIRAGQGTVKGQWIAATGLLLSLVSSTLGSAKMYHYYRTEVPDGYQRVNFPKEICEKEFVYIGGYRKLHPEVAPLIGKPVYIKGFMWATQATEGLTQFILLKDNGECCFGGNPKSHDFVLVKLPGYKAGGQPPAISKRSAAMSVKELTADDKKRLGGDDDFQLTTRAYLGKVAVAGVISADLKAGQGDAADKFEFATVYSMEADLVEEAWTRF
jgi:hypothetical protein